MDGREETTQLGARREDGVCQMAQLLPYNPTYTHTPWKSYDIPSPWQNPPWTYQDMVYKARFVCWAQTLPSELVDAAQMIVSSTHILRGE